MSQKIEVLLVDDHEIVRMGIEHVLNSTPDIHVMETASNGEDAVKIARVMNPDVILMDINMPGIGGTEAIKRIMSHNSESKILGLSVYDEGPIPQQILSFGALGYINKGCPVEEMHQAVKTVFAGKKYIASDVALNIALNPPGDSDNVFSQLSERELQITMKIIEGKGINDISDELAISPKTVNTHRYRVHDKLKVKSDIDLVILASKHNLL